MQVNTERGMICVVKEFSTVEEAENEGFYISFYSEKLKRRLYSKCLDDRGYRHQFALVEGL